jgi:L-iditol 2-dehydrogenase
MRHLAAAMTGRLEMTIEDRAMPTACPGQAVVRVEAIGICGSDTTYFTHGRLAGYVVDQPLVLGHELASAVIHRR